jgi:hypothetical protein
LFGLVWSKHFQIKMINVTCRTYLKFLIDPVKTGFYRILLELRFLTALAVWKKCIPKTGDVTQAFCQSCLPTDEHYICCPPPSCPIMPPNAYWCLKKTLYGLK